MFKLTNLLVAQKSSFIKISSNEYAANPPQKSAFANVRTRQPIEVFQMIKLYKEDTNEKKVNLSNVVYRTEENKPFVFPVVKKCEAELVQCQEYNHEYLPSIGNPEFTKAATELMLGDDSEAFKDERFVSIQCLSGSGGLRLGADFLAKILKKRTVYISAPTCANFSKAFEAAGFTQIKPYPYYNKKQNNIDIAMILATLSKAQEGAVVFLQCSAHNPTGLDPSKTQWKQIAEVVKRRNLLPFFDSAYQGLASGCMIRDAWPVRYFIEQGIEVMIVQAFSKTMGLYNGRIGNLIFVLGNKDKREAISSQVSRIVSSSYSNPPAFGSRVVTRILTDEEYRAEWEESVCRIADRIKELRKALVNKLKELETPGKWNFIGKQSGLYSYTGLNAAQCEQLIKDKHIYLPKSGRISICGLNKNNLNYVAQAINDVVRETTGKPKGERRTDGNKQDKKEEKNTEQKECKSVGKTAEKNAAQKAEKKDEKNAATKESKVDATKDAKKDAKKYGPNCAQTERKTGGKTAAEKEKAGKKEVKEDGKPKTQEEKEQKGCAIAKLKKQAQQEKKDGKKNEKKEKKMAKKEEKKGECQLKKDGQDKGKKDKKVDQKGGKKGECKLKKDEQDKEKKDKKVDQKGEKKGECKLKKEGQEKEKKVDQKGEKKGECKLKKEGQEKEKKVDQKGEKKGECKVQKKEQPCGKKDGKVEKETELKSKKIEEKKDKNIGDNKHNTKGGKCEK